MGMPSSLVTRTLLQLKEHRDFVAAVELVALHAHAPDLLRQRVLGHGLEAELVEEPGHVGQRHQALQADFTRLVGDARNEQSAEAASLELIGHDERAALAQALGEDLEAPAAGGGP